jgi:hypothetical protein
MTLKEKVIDWYLTRKTGKTKSEREWQEWYEKTINFRATRVRDIFCNFEHVVIVDPDKFFVYDPFAWAPKKEAQQYFWPARTLGENAVWRWERVMRAPSTGNEWEVNELGGEDTLFVATNNERDAIMIALKYS